MTRRPAGWLLLLALFYPPMGWSEETQYREFWYGAALNHLSTGLTVRVLQAKDTTYIRYLDLKLLGITPPDSDPGRIAGERFYDTLTLPRHRVVVDHLLRKAIFIHKQQPHLSPPPSRELLLTITANGEPIRDPQYLRFEDGELVLPEATMRALGIEPRKIWQPALEGAMPLHALAGERFTVDYEQLSLHTRLLPQVLATSRVNVTERRTATPEQTRDPPMDQRLAAVLSYDMTVGMDSQDNAWHSAFYDLSVGQGTTQCQAEYLDTPENRWLRLNTHCRRDWPDRRLSATLGDALGSGGPLTRPWRYRGIHVGTDFALQPNLLIIPSRSFTGIVDQPSTVEVWVDEALSFRQEIPAGPFEINDIPLRTGAGEVNAFVRPAFGQQQYFAYDFYIDHSLLAPGLSQWSLQAGTLRTGPFSDDTRYTDDFVAGHVRRGLHQHLTMGFALQATQTLTVANASAAVVVGDWLAIDTAVAASQHDGHISDLAWKGRISHQSRWVNVSYQVGRNPTDYHDLAWLAGTTTPEETRQLSLGLPLGHGLSFNYNDLYQRYDSGLELGLQTAGFTLRLGDIGSLRLSASRTQDDVAETIYGAHLTLPFGSSHSASLSTQTDTESHWQSASLQKNLPSGPGYGYMADFSTGRQYDHSTVRFDVQSAAGRLSLQGDSLDGNSRGSLRTTGSILASGDGINLSRRTQGSYAVVDVGVPNIPVYHGGQLKAYTDDDGKALIPGLRPFERNLIKIRAEDVPLDVQPDTLSTAVTPGRGEVAKVNFSFRRERYFSGKLTTSGGEPITIGANIYVDGVATTMVGNDGAFFIVMRESAFDFVVETAHGRCSVTVDAEDAEHSIVTELGTLLCQ